MRNRFRRTNNGEETPPRGMEEVRQERASEENESDVITSVPEEEQVVDEAKGKEEAAGSDGGAAKKKEEEEDTGDVFECNICFSVPRDPIGMCWGWGKRLGRLHLLINTKHPSYHVRTCALLAVHLQVDGNVS